MAQEREQATAIVPALRYRGLTWLYDLVIGPTTRQRTVQATVASHARLQAGDRVLDVGAGTGTLAILLKRSQPAATVVGLDPDPRILGMARSKGVAAGAAVTWVEGMAQRLPFRDGEFDRVVTSLTLHHLGDVAKRDALLEMRRVLRPAGMLLVADWDRPRGWLMRAAFLSVRLLDGWANTRAHAAGELGATITKAGFADLAAVAHFGTCCGTLTVFTATKSVEGDGPTLVGERR